MISIITAIHNQLAMNRLYWESLQKYTRNPFELIVIDNASTDGSAEFFESVGATVIRNKDNFAYPHCQNQGIAIASHDWLAFLNNDVIPCPQWDQILIDSMQANDLDVATCCGVETIESPAATQRLKRRWKLIRNLVTLCGVGDRSLRLMHRLMYGDWERFCAERRGKFAGQILNGFVGNTVMIHRRALDKIGLWDERIQGADFDLYLRTAVRARDHGDIRPMHIVLDCFVHHYIRLTVKGGYPPFADRDKLIQLGDKWAQPERRLLQAATGINPLLWAPAPDNNKEPVRS